MSGAEEHVRRSREQPPADREAIAEAKRRKADRQRAREEAGRAAMARRDAYRESIRGTTHTIGAASHVPYSPRQLAAMELEDDDADDTEATPDPDA